MIASECSNGSGYLASPAFPVGISASRMVRLRTIGDVAKSSENLMGKATMQSGRLKLVVLDQVSRQAR